MSSRKRPKKLMTRRRFIQSSATATAGLLLAACSGSTSLEEADPTEAVVQNPPTNTPIPATNTPVPPTATGSLTNSRSNTPAAQAETSNTPTTEPTATSTHTPTTDLAQQLVADMTQAAITFYEALDPAQREQVNYPFNSDERFRWHWTTPGRFPRNGLPLRQMNDEQRGRALDLLQASLSNMGFEKSLNIISLQSNLGNDPELYFVTLFGLPGTDEPWSWRWEGHHLSRQFTVIGDKVAMTPFFLGSWPTTTEAGLRAMAVEEDAALELINSFPGEVQPLVIFQDRPITSHITQNAAQVEPLDPVGVLYANMTGPQQQLVSEIIQAYIGTLPDHLALSTMARINSAGLDQIRFGWAGSLERQRPQYYRLQGPTFLLEYDNTRNGGIHIHSVWRDFTQDFGYHLL